MKFFSIFVFPFLLLLSGNDNNSILLVSSFIIPTTTIDGIVSDISGMNSHHIFSNDNNKSISQHQRGARYRPNNSVCRSHGTKRKTRGTTTSLYDISQWRDLCFDDSGENSVTIVNDNAYNKNEGENENDKGSMEDNKEKVNNRSSLYHLNDKRTICLLPFSHEDVLLQGETRTINLLSLPFEDNFNSNSADILLSTTTQPKAATIIRRKRNKVILDEIMNNHYGVVAMGLITHSGGTISSVPLCEIEKEKEGSSDNDTVITLRVVGRAKLLKVLPSQQSSFYCMKALCKETTDDDGQILDNDSLELFNFIADIIETTIMEINTMEHDLEKMKYTYISKLESSFMNKVDNVDENDHNRHRNEKEEVVVKNNDKNNESINDELRIRESSDNMDRYDRYNKAFEMALFTDTQGYTLTNTVASNNDESSSSSSSKNENDNDNNDTQEEEGRRPPLQRTLKELTAISWAAFCTDDDNDNTDNDDNNYYDNKIRTITSSSYRIQALATNSLYERLKLASKVLRERKAELQTKQIKLKKYYDDNINEKERRITFRRGSNSS